MLGTRRRSPNELHGPRTLFALVASRALAPSSKLAATRWIHQDVYIAGRAEVDSKSCYRAMDFFLDALDESQEGVFFTVTDCCSSRWT